MIHRLILFIIEGTVTVFPPDTMITITGGVGGFCVEPGMGVEFRLRTFWEEIFVEGGLSCSKHNIVGTAHKKPPVSPWSKAYECHKLRFLGHLVNLLV